MSILPQNATDARPDQAQGANLPRPIRLFDCNEIGNAERFIHHFGDIARYCAPWKSWMIWTGTHWQRDTRLEVNALAERVTRGILIEAATAHSDDARVALAKWYLKSATQNLIGSMVKMAAPHLTVTPEQFDRHPMLLNCRNGTVNLCDGEIAPHDAAQYLTKCLSIVYDPEAECPRWRSFLAAIMGESAELIEYLKRAVGYSLTGDTREQVMFVLHGAGANGKSTFLETIYSMIGPYAQNMQTETLMARQGTKMANDIARLRGVRFVIAKETDAGQRFSEAKVKELTGSDTLTGEFKFQEQFDFEPSHKLWFATNHLPQVRRGGHAIWRRLPLVEFNATFWDAEKGESGPAQQQMDKGLPAALKAELPGILTWAVIGAIMWGCDGLKAPAEVNRATDEYREDQDTLGAFLDDCCAQGDDCTVSTAALYTAYSNWADKNNEYAVSKRELSRQLKERGIESSERRGQRFAQARHRAFGRR